MNRTQAGGLNKFSPNRTDQFRATSFNTIGGQSGELGSTVSHLTRLTRKPRNQATIDTITNDARRAQADLRQLSKDIYDNVLEFRKAPGALNTDTIDVALKQRLWASPFRPERASHMNSSQSISPMSRTAGSKMNKKHRKSKDKLPDTSQFLKPQKKATKEQIEKCQEAFEDMKVKFDTLDQHKRMDRVTVQEQS